MNLGNTCFRCGTCCKVNTTADYIKVILLPEDVRSISQYLHINSKQFLAEYCVPFFIDISKYCQTYLLKALDGKCIFLHDSLCKIHTIKPYQCRMAPNDLFRGSDLWNYLPCYKRENTYKVTDSEIKFVESLLYDYYN
jgi:Fe-S-cluster containining protein